MAIKPLEEPYDLVRLASAANPAQAHIWQQALEDEGILAQVLGDNLEAGLGDLRGFSTEVWVKPTDLARAEAILRPHQDRADESVWPTEEA